MENQNKIPKIIHCCWLSGDPLPELYQQCVDSWKKIMPDYEIMLWDMKRFPVNEVLFVKQACEAKKWAYAADYIRMFALYNYGGIYLDMDVFVYRSFDPFLIHSAFSSVEFNAKHFYKSIKKEQNIEKLKGIAIEAAVLGAEKEHPWIKDILNFYQDREFINQPQYYWNIILTKVILEISMKKYGFVPVPVYQVLKDDIHLYSPDVFSSCYDLSLTKLPVDEYIYKSLGENQTRYAYHICAHSWWEGVNYNSLSYKIKSFFVNVLGKKNIQILKSLRKKQFLEI